MFLSDLVYLTLKQERNFHTEHTVDGTGGDRSSRCVQVVKLSVDVSSVLVTEPDQLPERIRCSRAGRFERQRQPIRALTADNPSMSVLRRSGDTQSWSWLRSGTAENLGNVPDDFVF